jgi:hypothetical protein
MRSPIRAFDVALADPVETGGALRYEVHERIGEIPAGAWDAVASHGSVFLSHGYLLALEAAMGDTMPFRYVLFRDATAIPVGVAVLQFAVFEDNEGRHSGRACGLGLFREHVRRERKLRALVCGNVFHCGDHGAHFVAGIPRALQVEALDRVTTEVLSAAGEKRRIAVRVFKELWPSDQVAGRVLGELGYHALATDVNMVLDIDPAWRDLHGYQDALTAKARTRLRAILQRSSVLEVKELDAAAIAAHTGRMQQLLDAVVERSPYIFGRLRAEAYADWKRFFKEAMVLNGYWLNGELVGFSAAFINGDCLDAQFVGIDYAHNHQHAIYLRMLVDLLELAIDRGLRRLVYGRTSEQAKSGLGAVPVAMAVHVKLCGSVTNMVAGAFIRSVKPGSFELRSPFKRERRERVIDR